MTEAPEIGSQIRRRRRELGFTLEDLAEASGVSATMLSEVERSMKNPTVKLAWQVARALDCSLTDLLQEGEEASLRVVRAVERSSLVDPETGLARHGISTRLRDRGLEVVWYEIPAGRSTGEMAPNRPGVLELVVGLSGRLRLRVGERQVEVEPGDSVTYEPQAVVEYAAGEEEGCSFLLLSDRGRGGRR